MVVYVSAGFLVCDFFQVVSLGMRNSQLDFLSDL